MKPRINVFQQFYYAIAKPKKYQLLHVLGMGRLILFSLILALLTAALTHIPVALEFIEHNGLDGIAQNFLPAYSYKDGELTLDYQYQGMVYSLTSPDNVETANKDISKLEDFDLFKPGIFYYLFRSKANTDESASQFLFSSDFYLYINTDIESVKDINFDELELSSSYEGLFITKTDYILYPESYYYTSKTIEEAYNNQDLEADSLTNLLGENSMSKDMFINSLKPYFPYIYCGIAIYILFSILFTAIGWYVSALFFSLFALIVNSIAKKGLPYFELYTHCVYAQTASITLSLVFSSFGYTNWLAFSWIMWLVTIVSVLMAVLLSKKMQLPPFQPQEKGLE